MGNEIVDTQTKQKALLITIPEIEVTLDKMTALVVNDIPDDVGLHDLASRLGPVDAAFSYVDTKYGNRQTTSAVVQMQLVEFGTFELDLKRAKRHLIETYLMDGEQVDVLIDRVKTHLIKLFPEFGEGQDDD